MVSPRALHCANPDLGLFILVSCVGLILGIVSAVISLRRGIMMLTKTAVPMGDL
jgi:hypothetical protein